MQWGHIGFLCVIYTGTCCRGAWTELVTPFKWSNHSVLDKWGHAVSQTEKHVQWHGCTFCPEWQAGFMIQLAGWVTRANGEVTATRIHLWLWKMKPIPPISDSVLEDDFLTWQVTGELDLIKTILNWIFTLFLHFPLCLICVMRWTYSSPWVTGWLMTNSSLWKPFIWEICELKTKDICIEDVSNAQVNIFPESKSLRFSMSLKVIKPNFLRDMLKKKGID